jgi:hypothetical protein
LIAGKVQLIDWADAAGEGADAMKTLVVMCVAFAAIPASAADSGPIVKERLMAKQ